MKRVLGLSILISLSISFAGAHYAQRSLGMDITAYSRQYHNVTVTPVYSSSLSDPVGMPFDLTAEDVRYVENAFNEGDLHTAGRKIAEWSLHSNFTPVNVIIQADPLTPADGGNTEIDYYLFFPYIYHDIGNNIDVSGFMMIQSGEIYHSINDYDGNGNINPISEDLRDVNGVSIGLDIGTYPVRFMLKEDVSKNIGNRQIYPSGVYTADVTITLEGNE